MTLVVLSFHGTYDKLRPHNGCLGYSLRVRGGGGCGKLMGSCQEVSFANCCAKKARRFLAYQPQVKLEEGLAVMIDWIKSPGPRPFLHNVALEINGALAPQTWSKKIL